LRVESRFQIAVILSAANDLCILLALPLSEQGVRGECPLTGSFKRNKYVLLLLSS
jgi:hypothetical protein